MGQNDPHIVSIPEMLPDVWVALLEGRIEMHDAIGRFANDNDAFDNGALSLAISQELYFRQRTDIALDVRKGFPNILHPIKNAP